MPFILLRKLEVNGRSLKTPSNTIWLEISSAWVLADYLPSSSLPTLVASQYWFSLHPLLLSHPRGALQLRALNHTWQQES